MPSPVALFFRQKKLSRCMAPAGLRCNSDGMFSEFYTYLQSDCTFAGPSFVIGQQTIQFTPVFAINGSCKRQIAALATTECFNQPINRELELSTFDDQRSPAWLFIATAMRRSHIYV
jgi:hypothetical protein